MKIKVLLLFLLAVGSFVLSSCSFQRDPIVGYWEVHHRVWSFRPYGVFGTSTESTAFGPLTLHFESDHTLVVTGTSYMETYHWRWVESNALEIKTDTYTGTYPADLNGDDLVLHNFSGATTLTCARASGPSTQHQCVTDLP